MFDLEVISNKSILFYLLQHKIPKLSSITLLGFLAYLMIIIGDWWFLPQVNFFNRQLHLKWWFENMRYTYTTLSKVVYSCEPKVSKSISFKQWVHIEGEEKSLQDILLSTAKLIYLRVKNQARGQNNRSTTLKWGIVHLCNLNIIGDTKKCMKIWVFKFLRFCKKWQYHYIKLQKMRKFKK